MQSELCLLPALQPWEHLLSSSHREKKPREGHNHYWLLSYHLQHTELELNTSHLPNRFSFTFTSTFDTHADPMSTKWHSQSLTEGNYEIQRCMKEALGVWEHVSVGKVLATQAWRLEFVSPVWTQRPACLESQCSRGRNSIPEQQTNRVIELRVQVRDLPQYVWRKAIQEGTWCYQGTTHVWTHTHTHTPTHSPWLLP